MKKKTDRVPGTSEHDYSELNDLFAAAKQGLIAGQSLEGKDGVLIPLIKKIIESSLQGEMDEHLSSGRPNRRNGQTSKQVKTSYGKVEIDTPRDRDCNFEPQLIEKRQTTLGSSIDNKIISLYSMGMSYRDINSHITEMYGMDLSPALLTSITDRVWPELEEWANRPLERIYTFVWLDAAFYKVRQDGQVQTMAVYSIIGMTIDGQKEVLGIYTSASESSKFWLQVLSDLQSRGIKDILIVCIDNLSGFKEAIASIYPRADVQLCIVHQIRNSLRYVPWTDSREVVADMKTIYRAPNIGSAELALESFSQKWNKSYPAMIKSWHNNWTELTAFFDYPEEIRKIMYTTNAIEAYHRQLRKATKTKGAFTSERALLKLLYLVVNRIEAKWQMAPKFWKRALNILEIRFGERMHLNENSAGVVEMMDNFPNKNRGGSKVTPRKVTHDSNNLDGDGTNYK